MKPLQNIEKSRGATQNTCVTCAPLGAALFFKGIERAISIMHGSQGCATYIRRYMISHFREPMDIASSSFSESTAIFGGAANLKAAIKNVIAAYNPSCIGINSTCLSETIGEDLEGFIRETQENFEPILLSVSTPSYAADHAQGFFKSAAAIVRSIAETSTPHQVVTLFPGFVSCADIRHYKYMCRQMDVSVTVLPDYSETLDNGLWEQHQPLPAGGTPITAIQRFGDSCSVISCGAEAAGSDNIAEIAQKKFNIPGFSHSLPLGIEATDLFLETLSRISGKSMSSELRAARNRVTDAYVDGHKYLFGKRVAIIGDEDWCVALHGFCSEIGLEPVLIASGGRSGLLKKKFSATSSALPIVLSGVDFTQIEAEMQNISVDFVLGSSKAYHITRKKNIPLIRVGFPIHDRFGGHRQLHIGYEGTLRLVEQIINIILASRQEEEGVGYAYL